jgi:peptidoglycan hydrolase-like protein with peptidoglycan-binding domain
MCLGLTLLAAAGLGVFVGGASAQTSSSTTAKKKSTTASTSSGKARTKKTSSRKKKERGQMAPTADRISEIQTALAKDGSFGGSPNGKWDDSTVEAIRKFQTTHGLNPSGKIDARTLQKLGLGSQTAGVAAPTPPPNATSRLVSSSAGQATDRR